MTEKLFGVKVEDLTDVVLAQMVEETSGKVGASFVMNETSNLISVLTPDELKFADSLDIKTHIGTYIRHHVTAELDRRLKGRRVIAELLHKLGVVGSPESIEQAWQKAETTRRAAGPREVPVRHGLRLERRA